MYWIDDLQACEPDALVAFLPDGIKVTVDVEHDDTSAGCARVSVYAPTKEALLDFVRYHWGDDDGEWFATHVVARIGMKCPDCVWHAPPTNEDGRVKYLCPRHGYIG
jgi:hypothetical protein